MPKITQVKKINRDGGPGYRITGVQDSLHISQEDLDALQHIRIGVASPYGLISSPYSLEAKKQSGQGHNICKGAHADYASVFEFVRRHTYRRPTSIINLNALKKQLEVELQLITPLKYWKGRAVLAIIPEGQETPDLSPPTCIRAFITPKLRDSFENTFARDQSRFRDQIREFALDFKYVPRERDIYTLNHHLRFLGITLQHFRRGIDAPKAEITFLNKRNRKKIIVMPIELKTHSAGFYSDAKSAKGANKYWSHVPLSVLCIRHNSKEWKKNSGIGILCIEDIIRVCAEIASIRVRLPMKKAA